MHQLKNFRERITTLKTDNQLGYGVLFDMNFMIRNF